MIGDDILQQSIRRRTKKTPCVDISPGMRLPALITSKEDRLYVGVYADCVEFCANFAVVLPVRTRDIDTAENLWKD